MKIIKEGTLIDPEHPRLIVKNVWLCKNKSYDD